MDYVLAELDRKLANLVSLGTVAELDEAGALVRVDLGGIVTEWMPWLTTRAGGDRTWWAPEVGEQVVVLAPSGDLAQGVALPALYQNAHPAPGSSKDRHITLYSDGTRSEYDRAAGVLTVDCVGDVVVKGARTMLIEFGGQVTVRTPVKVLLETPLVETTQDLVVQGSATVAGSVQVDGSIHSNGDTVAGSISLQGHTHGGVRSGGEQTGPPG